MSVQAQKKILLALDGSDAALETVKYVSKIPLFQNMQLVLFNVFSKVPEYYFDLGKKPRFDQRIRDIPTLKSQHEKNLQQYMDRARRFLIEAGIPMGSVSIKIQERHTGIARDIVREAQVPIPMKSPLDSGPFRHSVPRHSATPVGA